MIFSADFDRRKVNPLIYVKFWWQACLLTLLYGSELFTLAPNLLEKLEWCQLWFIRNIFYVPKFTPKPLLLKLSGLNSVESEIAIKKMLFLGRLILGAKRLQLSEACLKVELKVILIQTLLQKVFCQVFARYFPVWLL